MRWRRNDRRAAPPAFGYNRLGGAIAMTPPITIYTNVG